MKILLIVPNIKSYDVMPCLSVATLKGYINKATKHKAKVVDLVYHRMVWKKHLSELINEENPDLIGISVLSFNYPEALQIARFIKNNFDKKIIFGGVHVILAPEEVIQNDEIDIVCLGEGEQVLKELLDNSLDCKDVKGIWYKRNGKIVKNEKLKLIEDLDSFPFPDFDDFNVERYFIVNHNHFPIMGSRGCPYSCTFCGNHALKKNLVGKYVRFRSVDNILEEVEQRIKQFYDRGFRYFYFFDDTFILYKDFVFEFCKKYKKKGFHKKVKWTANVRANLVTDDVIKAMKDAGCYEVRMGVESGNDYIRNTVYNRNMSKEQLLNSFKIIKKHGLGLRLDFILGAPFETVEMMEESLELAKQSGGDRIFFAKLYPFPGTEIKKICENEHTIDGIDFDNIGMPPVDKTSFISSKQLKKFSKKINQWQGQRYINKGFELNGLGFIWDIFLFLFYYKRKYDLEYNQIFRWNVQRYKLIKS
ncbi:MAG: radical SAM protein [Thermoplasmatales archaeon]|nr:radical SAM protein [Thermoplasmatales archaeon]